MAGVFKTILDRAGNKLATPGSPVRLASVARHLTACATWPGTQPAYGINRTGMTPQKKRKLPELELARTENSILAKENKKASRQI